MKKTILQRFWNRVLRTERCWVWNGAKVNGYGQISTNGKTEYVHRFSYEMVNGKIPEGLVIDHLCRNRACVNPAHL